MDDVIDIDNTATDYPDILAEWKQSNAESFSRNQQKEEDALGSTFDDLPDIEDAAIFIAAYALYVQEKNETLTANEAFEITLRKLYEGASGYSKAMQKIVKTPYDSLKDMMFAIAYVEAEDGQLLDATAQEVLESAYEIYQDYSL